MGAVVGALGKVESQDWRVDGGYRGLSVEIEIPWGYERGYGGCRGLRPVSPSCGCGGCPTAIEVPITSSAPWVTPHSKEFPRSTPPPNGCTLKRTFACTNLLLLSLADPDGATDGGAFPGPQLHTPCLKNNGELSTPLVSDHWGCPNISGAP